MEEKPTFKGRPASVGVPTIVRRLASGPAAPISVILVVLVTGFILSGWPRLFTQLSETALQTTLADSATAKRNLTVDNISRIEVPSGEDPQSALAHNAQEFFEESIPEWISALTSESRHAWESFVLDVGPYPGDPPTTYPIFTRFRGMEDVEDHITMVDGRFPRPHEPAMLWRGEECPVIEVGQDPRSITAGELVDVDGDGFVFCADTAVEVFEVAFSEETLAEMGVGVGDRLLLRPDFADPLVHPDFEDVDPLLGPFDVAVVVEVAGSFKVDDPEGDYWFDDSLARPSKLITADLVQIHPTGLLGDDDYARFLDEFGGSFLRYSTHYTLDLEDLEIASARTLATDMERLQAENPSPTVYPGDQAVSTGLVGIIDEYFAQRGLAVSIMALSLVGVLVVTLAMVWLLAAMIARNQRRSTVQFRNRGGSRGQAITTNLIQATLLVVPAAAVAYGLTGLMPGNPEPASVALITSLAVLSIACFVIVGWSAAAGELGSLQRDSQRPGKTAAFRVVVEVLVIAAAVGSVVVLRRRPLEAGFDPLASLGPALLAFAAAVVTMRLYPFLMRAFAYVGARRRGAIGFVGFQRVLQLAPDARLPLTVVLISVSTAVFTYVIWSSINDGQVEASYHTVGADYRINRADPTTALPPDLTLDDVAGVQATALATLSTGVIISFEGQATRDFADLLAIDGADYAAVTAGTAADMALGEAFRTPPQEPNLGAVDNPIPVVVSPELFAGVPTERGMVFTMLLGIERPYFVVDQISDRFPLLEEGSHFVVAPRGAIEAYLAPEPIRPTILYVRAPASSLPNIREAVERQAFGMQVFAQAPLYDEVHSATQIAFVDTILRLTSLVAALFAMAGGVIAIVMLTPTRTRDLGYLSTMGLSRRQGIELTLIEQIPPMAIAAVAGGILGIAIGDLLGPMIDIGPFVGPGLTPVLSGGRWIVFTITGALIVVLVLMVLITTRQAQSAPRLPVTLGDE